MAGINVPPRRGSRHGSAKLDEEFVVHVRRSAHEMGYYPVARIARANGVTYRALKDALTGRTYTHVDRFAPPFLGPTRKPSSGCVVRIDSASTHGWQARFQGRSKFFSDGVYGDQALIQAKTWLARQAANALVRPG